MNKDELIREAFRNVKDDMKLLHKTINEMKTRIIKLEKKNKRG